MRLISCQCLLQDVKNRYGDPTYRARCKNTRGADSSAEYPKSSDTASGDFSRDMTDWKWKIHDHGVTDRGDK